MTIQTYCELKPLESIVHSILQPLLTITRLLAINKDYGLRPVFVRSRANRAPIGLAGARNGANFKNSGARGIFQFAPEFFGGVILL